MTDSTTGARIDAVELLTSQHREVEQLWSQVNERGASGPDQQGELVRQIVRLLSQHDAVETRLLYPAVREVEGGDALADHSLDEHQEIRECLKEVDRADAIDPSVLSRLGECIEAVQRHVQEEEGVIFPKLRAAMSQEQLYDLGGDMAYATEKGPTHPHPTTPNNPVGAAVAGAVTGAMDRARDAIKGDR
ncbi:MAG: hemerythrin domain-containing protein [Acidimicrobiia bacterium]|nr:hemerythrin domain-containing protein [Acidimicrobiia bacterium]